VVHGLINAPLSQVEFGNVANTANAEVLGDVVAAGIDMQASTGSSFVIFNSSIPAQTRILMRSTATDAAGIAVVVQAVIDYQPSRFVLDGSVSSGSTTVSSASASFTASDIGNGISGTGIPGGTTVAAVASATGDDLRRRHGHRLGGAASHRDAADRHQLLAQGVGVVVALLTQPQSDQWMAAEDHGDGAGRHERAERHGRLAPRPAGQQDCAR